MEKGMKFIPPRNIFPPQAKPIYVTLASGKDKDDNFMWWYTELRTHNLTLELC